MTEALLKTLYCEQHLSMMEIAKRLRTTHATVLYWLKKHRIARRSWSESTYVKLNPNGDPFLIPIPTALSPKQRELLVAGLMLYWAEGSKSKSAVRIANLDGRMLQIFSRFLLEVCRAEKKRLSVYVRVHRKFDLDEAKDYWARLLKLPAAQIFVYPHTDLRSKHDKQWTKHGLATLEFHNTKFKQWLDAAIETLIERYLSVTGHGTHR